MHQIVKTFGLYLHKAKSDDALDLNLFVRFFLIFSYLHKMLQGYSPIMTRAKMLSVN